MARRRNILVWASRQSIRPLVRYGRFAGRASRAELWLFTLLVLVGAFLCTLIEWLVLGWPPIGGPDVLGVGFSLLMLVPSLAVTSRRLHDIGRSGWWQLVVLAPVIGWLALLYWSVQPGDKAANRFGPPP